MPAARPKNPTLHLAGPKWRQIADYLRSGILSGRWPAGQPLPSEETLTAELGVSRPTIRQAVKSLSDEGLVVVRRPFGAIVRDPYAAAATTEERTLTDTWEEPSGPRWTVYGKPVYLRVDATVAHAELLAGVGSGTPMLTRETLQINGDARRSVWLALPFTLAGELETPWADKPRLPAPAEVYRWLAAQGHVLTVTDHVRARMPVGDETQSLAVTPGTPLLIATRVTSVDGTPAVLEETRTPADHTSLVYPVTTPGSDTTA